MIGSRPFFKTVNIKMIVLDYKARLVVSHAEGESKGLSASKEKTACLNCALKKEKNRVGLEQKLYMYRGSLENFIRFSLFYSMRQGGFKKKTASCGEDGVIWRTRKKEKI
jgi:hypothetical protein